MSEDVFNTKTLYVKPKQSDMLQGVIDAIVALQCECDRIAQMYGRNIYQFETLSNNISGLRYNSLNPILPEIERLRKEGK